MKPRTRTISKSAKSLVAALFLVLAPSALAVNTWYVDGVNGNDSNDCKSAQTACKTIGHTITVAHSTDFIMVAPATYVENLTIRKNLRIIGSDAATTIVDGNQAGTVFTISNSKAYVRLSKLTIRNGSAQDGGGVSNSGILTINRCTINGNSASCANGCGGGAHNSGILTLSNSTISGNVSAYYGGGITNFGTLAIDHTTISGNNAHAWGGGIYSTFGTLKIDRSTISGNSAYGGSGIYNAATLTINNSTISGNNASQIGGINNWGTLAINNSTISGNSAYWGGGIGNLSGTATLQNSIVAQGPSGGNCYGQPVTSNGYNLSSDNTCTFSGPGDMNNTNPNLGVLGYYGGPTMTIPIRQGSPAIDAGNPNGCTDSAGNLLKTDQRGFIRPDNEDNSVCDIGAFERQKNKW